VFGAVYDLNSVQKWRARSNKRGARNIYNNVIGRTIGCNAFELTLNGRASLEKPWLGNKKDSEIFNSIQFHNQNKARLK
jgi:predicted RNA-binding protein with PUA domain